MPVDGFGGWCVHVKCGGYIYSNWRRISTWWVRQRSGAAPQCARCSACVCPEAPKDALIIQFFYSLKIFIFSFLIWRKEREKHCDLIKEQPCVFPMMRSFYFYFHNFGRCSLRMSSWSKDGIEMI